MIPLPVGGGFGVGLGWVGTGLVVRMVGCVLLVVGRGFGDGFGIRSVKLIKRDDMRIEKNVSEKKRNTHKQTSEQTFLHKSAN